MGDSTPFDIALACATIIFGVICAVAYFRGKDYK